MYGFHIVKELDPEVPQEDDYTVASECIVKRLDGTITIQEPYTAAQLSAIVEKGEQRAKRPRKRK